MMCENITLLDFGLEFAGEDIQNGISELINFHMKLNRMWKRYIMKREREKKAPAVITLRKEGDNNNKEEERKKRLKMRLLFCVFHKKPVMRDTIIFHLLREYPDDLIDTNTRIDGIDRDDNRGNDRDDDINSDNYDKTHNVWSESDDGESDIEGNDDTNDDSDGDSDSGDSDSENDDSTDGTL